MIRRTKHFRLYLLTGGVAWAALTLSGFSTLGVYQSTPGAVGETSPAWPSESGIRLATGRDTLVMLAHPRCPCTTASISELSKIMTQCQGRVEGRVLFYTPEGAGERWAMTSSWKSAEAIPGVQVFADKAGRDAACFGAESSGQVLLFDRTGRLLFSGGITGGRGEEGDNPGCETVIALITRGEAEQTRSLVYGCPIFDRRSP